jgi:transcriptional regulator NrdR family protein
MASYMSCPKCDGLSSHIINVRQKGWPRKPSFIKDAATIRRHSCKCGFYYSTVEISWDDLLRAIETEQTLLDLKLNLDAIRNA